MSSHDGLPQPFGPEEHQEARRLLGLRNVGELLALSAKHDPFYSGTPADRRDAEWFAELWERLGASRVHLRRVHYQALSIGWSPPPRVRHKYAVYENNGDCWGYLGAAAEHARYLGLVDPEQVVDRRNKPLQQYVWPREAPEPWWGWPSYDAVATRWSPTWRVPSIDPDDFSYGDIDLDPYWSLPHLQASGYDYVDADQPALLEVWAEKTTVDDVLAPLCDRLGVNLLSGAGYQSVTNLVALLRRVEAYGSRRAHVLYVSDYDPAGRNMPFQAARQIQFWHDRLRSHAELTLQPLVLTRGQVAEYDLPPAPDGHNVELDALEALRPGVLRRVVLDAVIPWRDPDLAARLDRTQRDAQRSINDRWQDATTDLRANLDTLEEEVRAVTDRYRDRGQAIVDECRERLRAVATELAGELELYQERLDAIASDAERLAGEFDPELPARPEPEEPDVDRDELLYDSARDWQEQLQAYRQRKEVTDG